MKTKYVMVLVGDNCDFFKKTAYLCQKNQTQAYTYSEHEWAIRLKQPDFLKNFCSPLDSQNLTPNKDNLVVLPFNKKNQFLSSSHLNSEKPIPLMGGASENTPTQTVNEAQLIAVKKALNFHNGNVTMAARTLGIGRATLYRKIRESNIKLVDVRKVTKKQAA